MFCIPKLSLQDSNTALASSFLTIILHNHTPNCCYKSFLVMASASLGFTGRQKLLPFLKLQNTGNVSIWLPTAKRLHKSDIKKNKTPNIWNVENITSGCFSLQVSLKPSLKTDINFKKNYMIEKSTTKARHSCSALICLGFWISYSL